MNNNLNPLSACLNCQCSLCPSPTMGFFLS
ncbi:hypothetical protein AB5R89_000277 [Enterobacter ludwigii]